MTKIKVGIIESTFAFTNQVLKNTTGMEDIANEGILTELYQN